MTAHLGMWPHDPTHPAAEGELSFLLTVSPTSSMIEQIKTAKQSLMTEALFRSGGNVSAAARLLGTSRDVLRHLMKTLRLDRS